MFEGLPNNVRSNRVSLKSGAGFTMVEIIVVIAITTFMASILISYSHKSGEQIILNTEKAKIAQTILRVKSLTLAGFTQPLSEPPPCSYGFYIDYTAKTYSIFEYSPVAGCDSILDSNNNPINTDPPISPSPLGFKVISTEKLSPEVKFTTPLPADHLVYIVFVPPDPKVIVFNDDRSMYLGSNPKVIYLETRSETLKTAIGINVATGQLSL